MSRPSSNLDKKLIQAGKRIISRKGAQGLTIASICKEANVNLGMFNYHFQTMDNFITVLNKDIKEKIEKYIDIKQVEGKSPMYHLGYLLIKLGKYAQRNQKFIRFITLDVLMNDKYNEALLDNKVLPTSQILDYIIAAQESGELKKEFPAIEIYSSIIMRFLNPEVFKKEFVKREKLFGATGPSFANFEPQTRLNNVFRHYITDSVMANEEYKAWSDHHRI